MNGNSIELKERKPLMGDDGNEDIEEAAFRRRGDIPPSRKTMVVVYALCGFCLAGWLLALFLFLRSGTYQHKSTRPHDPSATSSVGNGKPVTFDQIMGGQWYASSRQVSWIQGVANEDGLILETDGSGIRDYLIVQDIRSLQQGATVNHAPKVLMKRGQFTVNGMDVYSDHVVPSADMENILVNSNVQKNWRHSSIANYWIFNVKTQKGEPLDPERPLDPIQLATWAPTSDAIVFTRENNMYLRKIGEPKVIQITTDGGPELFYGVPDWVYEEEVFAGSSASWWSVDGKYVAYLRTNESGVS